MNYSDTEAGEAAGSIVVQVQFFGGSQLFSRRMPAEVAAALPSVTLPAGARVDDLLRYLWVDTGNERPLVNLNRWFQRDNVELKDGDRVHLYRTVVGG